jgi:putative phosphotransacetylase
MFEVKVNVSNRHIHISRKDIDSLFGVGYQLTKKIDLMQPGQWAANETLTLIGPKGRIEKVRILGPERKETQVEISMTDARVLGVRADLRMSGSLTGTPGITLVNEKDNRSIEIDRGVIVAKAHIHAPKNCGLQDGLMWLRTNGDRRGLIEVVVRTDPNFVLEAHIDTDEANAIGLPNGGIAEIF